MLGSTPGAACSNKVTDLLTVEGNMRRRFDKIHFWRQSLPTLVPKMFTRSKTLEGNETLLSGRFDGWYYEITYMSQADS